jgi:hypothetical protein
MRIYRRKRKLPDGTIEEYGAYQYQIYDHGKPIRGSTEKYDLGEAKTFVKILEGRISEDKPLQDTRKRFGELLDYVITDYELNRRKTWKSTKQRIEKSIRPALGGRKVKDITTSAIRSYVKKRSGEGASNGTCNRELNIISKAFSLADLPADQRLRS